MKTPTANCEIPVDFKTCEECDDNTCFYFKNDRCTFLDSDTQIWLSGNEENM
ncbi:hypothetical protein [Clostridium guangxiense]|uniref:hypothetical protein n=1 Tax=Clostridium guangxiense TaxID=1662055 RepID=UPI001E41ACBA|nr:hypothetical protein [Clostridium guangxiense]MCD2345787.1 hypothetical protein [Clostridium guangxiense]